MFHICLHINSHKPPSSLVSFPFYRWGNWVTERLSNINLFISPPTLCAKHYTECLPVREAVSWSVEEAGVAGTPTAAWAFSATLNARKCYLRGCLTNDLWPFLQIVRTDLKELRDFNLDGAPYGYTPFCDSRKEMDGYRFWKSGYWASHLAGRKYHIRYWKWATPNTVFLFSLN